MSLFRTLLVSGSALAAERLRADIASSNIANANSTRTVEGGPYRRRDPIFQSAPVDSTFGTVLERSIQAVRVPSVQVDQRPPREVYNPTHPDADENGIVRLPNVDVIEEMVNLRGAQRSFEANLTAISAAREMALRALRLGRNG
jgi:flagellar basal-body rod protein FlgC